MRSNMSAASRMPWPTRRTRVASTASCVAIFITLRSSASAASFTSTTATGLKAAPPLSKMPVGLWRFSAGQLSARAANLRARMRNSARSQQSPHKSSPMTAQPATELVVPAAGVAPAFRVLLVTDAWAPQVNGVVRTLEILGRDLAAMGHEVHYATPEGRFTVGLPTYPEIRLAVFPRRSLER